ncbi:probable disease resistance protein RPP1 [Cryptomeria japonica]|uniref:probable disease resistance protein RPP1 n=1 Tax=Cryptomeria japonica TaxID=3369 RepID=UPI0027D9F1FC|nr:probable disease resistance protein RPP1 [Cryptomeria japonica]
MQEQILKDGFPSHNSGKSINFRDTEEGKKCLKEAFKKDKNPVFLYIDNALREEELSELLPEGLEDLGKHIRLLLTTRNLSATNVFKKKFRQEYLVEPLQNTDAKKVLCKDAKNLDRIKDDVDEILNICDGVPLVLKIVGAHLENQGFKKDNCNQILSALKKGEVIKEKDLSRCMVDFVFKTLEESTQEAFLDICCFFHLFPRTSVEYAVGSMEVKALEGAALIKFKVIPEYYAPMQKHEELVLVHDVIKEKGRNMARLNRIRGIKSFEAAVAEKRLESIKGIDLFLNKDHSSYVLEKEHLNSMSKSLRFLKLGPKIKVSAPSETTFPELRYLYLSDIFSCVPFHSEALETLAVYVGHLPNDNCICKKFTQDQYIQARPEMHSGAIKADQNASAFLSRRIVCKLIIDEDAPSGTPEFQSIGTTGMKWRSWQRVVELKALQYLNLKGCTSLKKLPSTFGELRALQGLNLEGCSSLEEIAGFKRLIGLKYLNARNCPKLSLSSATSPASDLRIKNKEEMKIEEKQQTMVD